MLREIEFQFCPATGRALLTLGCKREKTARYIYSVRCLAMRYSASHKFSLYYIYSIYLYSQLTLTRIRFVTVARFGFFHLFFSLRSVSIFRGIIKQVVLSSLLSTPASFNGASSRCCCCCCRVVVVVGQVSGFTVARSCSALWLSLQLFRLMSGSSSMEM